MKKSECNQLSRHVFILVCMTLTTVAFLTTFAYSEDIKLRLEYSDVEAFPIQMGNGIQMADPPGISVELIKRAGEALGVKIEFARCPNKRVLFHLQNGDADGAFCYSFLQERMENGRYPLKNGQLDNNRRITAISYYLYKKKESSLDWDGTDFKNLQGSLGGNDGYSIVNDLRGKGIKIDEAKTTEQNMIKLQLGRIAGYVMQDITADYYAASGLYGEIVKIPIPLVTKDYFLMLSHQFVEQHPDIAEQLWTKIGEIRDSVTKELVVKYLQSIK